MSDLKKSDSVSHIIRYINTSETEGRLPATLNRNIGKAINKLVFGTAQISLAWFRERAQLLLSLRAPESGTNRQLIETSIADQSGRAAIYAAAAKDEEQFNRESVVEQAVSDIQDNPPKEDARNEIADDWLTMFGRIAEQKSDKDVQLFLSKILAGEIRRPGSFSFRSLNIVALLDQRAGQLFQKFCDLSFSSAMVDTFLLTEPIGNPGQNAMLPWGLQYSALTRLQDEGLIQHDLNAWKEFHPIIFATGFNLGSYVVQPGRSTHDAISKLQMMKVKIINFTNSGLEVKKILHLGTDSSYNAKVIDWVNSKYNFDIN